MYLKYRPLEVARVGSRAAYKVVCDPDRGVFRKGQAKGLTKILKIIRVKMYHALTFGYHLYSYLAKKLLKMLMCRISSVSTIPG